jgi:hypothetical protein
VTDEIIIDSFFDGFSMMSGQMVIKTNARLEWIIHFQVIKKLQKFIITSSSIEIQSIKKNVLFGET